MPSRKKRRARPTYRRLSSRTDTATLKATYLTVKSEKLSQRLKDLSGRPGKGTTTAIAKENGNNPALQEQCDNVRKAAVDALNTYASLC
jgi:hypothetical protein